MGEQKPAKWAQRVEAMRLEVAALRRDIERAMGCGRGPSDRREAADRLCVIEGRLAVIAAMLEGEGR
jgi:hypothetical protein